MSFSLDASVDVGLGVGGIAKDDSVVPFSLVAGAFVKGQLRVVSFVAHEALHDAYAYDVTFIAEGNPTLLSAGTFGFPACLTLHAPNHSPRVIQGTVDRFSIVGRLRAGRAAGQNLYRIRIVPNAQLLTLSKRRRIFQRVSVRTIVSRILDTYEIPFVWRTNAADHVWKYAYECHENLWEFITRMLAICGVSFCFEHAHGLLETMMPGSSAYAALGFNPMDLGADALGGGVVGAALSGAIGVAATPTRIVFFDEPRSSPAVSDELAVDEAIADVASAALGSIASAAGNAVGGAVGVDLSMALGPTADPIVYEDGLAAVDGRERIESFIFSQNLRAKRAIVHEHLTAEHRHNMTDATLGVGEAWLSASLNGAATAASDLAHGNLRGALSASMPSLASFGADISAPLIDADRMTIEEHGQDPSMLNPAWNVDVTTTEPALRALEQHRHDAFEAEGVTNCRRLAPGYRFKLQGHPIAECNREYLVTSLHCEGIDPELAEMDEVPFVYKASFRAVPAVHPVRPPKPSMAPRVGPEDATVVGPPGSKIYVDELNRVQVKFDWAGQSTMPSDGERDIVGLVDNTCFLDVITPMGAPGGNGMQQPLRVGTRVKVDFTDGQPERPFVVGCIPSKFQPPPFKGGHIVGTKIRSEPSGRRHNEMSFHNADGNEKIQIHAGKDLVVDVAEKLEQTIGGAMSVRVKGDHSLDVGGACQHGVAGPMSLSAQRLALQVGEYNEATLARSTNVRGDWSINVQGDDWTTIGGGRCAAIKGDHAIAVGGAESTRVAGLAEHTLEGGVIRVVGTSTANADETTVVHGTVGVYATKEVRITAHERIVFTVGDTVIELTPDALSLLAKALTATGSDTATLTGKGAAVALDGKAKVAADGVKLVSSSSAIEVADAVKITASSIKLASGSGESASADKKDKKDEETQTVTVIVHDDTRTLLAGKTFEAIGAGFYKKDKTDDAGTVNVDIPKALTTLRVEVWHGEYPKGDTSIFTLDLSPIEPIDALPGVLRRLVHLGFYNGPVDAPWGDETAAALAEFQAHADDPDVVPTGELDDKTRDALKKAHGS